MGLLAHQNPLVSHLFLIAATTAYSASVLTFRKAKQASSSITNINNDNKSNNNKSNKSTTD